MIWNSISSFLMLHYSWFGISGSLVIIFSMLVTGLVYRGGKGERYSVFNHYISELGEVGVSGAAAMFNSGLIVGSLLFVPFIVGMGLTLHNLWAWIGMAVGIWATVSCALVGVFPMNHMDAHARVAMSYFRSGLVMVILYGVAVLVQPTAETVIPKASNSAGLLACLCYASFLLLVDTKKKEEEGEPLDETHSKEEFERPKFWKVAILEWAVFFSTVLWFLIVALFALN
jgi:hypothetical membrane protein